MTAPNKIAMALPFHIFLSASHFILFTSYWFSKSALAFESPDWVWPFDDVSAFMQGAVHPLANAAAEVRVASASHEPVALSLREKDTQEPGWDSGELAAGLKLIASNVGGKLSEIDQKMKLLIEDARALHRSSQVALNITQNKLQIFEVATTDVIDKFVASWSPIRSELVAVGDLLTETMTIPGADNILRRLRSSLDVSLNGVDLFTESVSQVQNQVTGISKLEATKANEKLTSVQRLSQNPVDMTQEFKIPFQRAFQELVIAVDEQAEKTLPFPVFEKVRTQFGSVRHQALALGENVVELQKVLVNNFQASASAVQTSAGFRHGLGLASIIALLGCTLQLRFAG